MSKRSLPPGVHIILGDSAAGIFHQAFRAQDQLLIDSQSSMHPRLLNGRTSGNPLRSRRVRVGMQPIHELLSQIRWDPNFTGEFEIAFADHLKPDLQRVPVNELRFDARDRSVFRAFDEQGNVVSIPFHRIRKVYRDGQLIWNRDTESHIR